MMLLYCNTQIDRRGEKAVYKTEIKSKKHKKVIYMQNDGHERDDHDKHY